MKGIENILALLVAVTLLSAFSQVQETLKIGDKAPKTTHDLVDTAGRYISLDDVARSKGLLVLFSCNTCPWVAKWEDRLNSLADYAEDNDIGMIALNPNERIRNRGESMADMRTRAQKKQYNFPYALDQDHVLADAFGASRTPEVFLFDGDMRLVYHGSIDDNANRAAGVKQSFARDAMTQMAQGNTIKIKETQLVGCTIKRNE